MADSAIGIDRGIDAPAYSPLVSGDRGGNRSLRSHPADAPDPTSNDLASLIKLGITKVEMGADAEATDCFRKALDIGDRTLGPENPDLMLLLNDLTRLYLKQSAYAEAEPLLLRLLEMKRSKGEDHPEVATVLASLATVRQALGRHESAEQLWRRVLEIRERTLAPNHFAIATALEHLGDACAARGNIGEALPAYQRALTIRERTLGSGHPSLRTSKERIADLQLQSAEDTFEAPGGAMMPTPEKYRLLSGDHVRLSSPVPAREEFASPSPREAAPPVATRQTRVVLQIPTSEPLVPTTQTLRDAVVDVTASANSEAMPYRDALQTIREELEQPYPAASLSERFAVWVETLTAFLTRRQVVAVMIVGVVALLLLAVSKERAWGEFDQNGAANGAASQRIGPPAPAPASLGALATPVHDPVSVATASVPAKTVPAKPKVEERTTARRSEPETKKITLPTISTSIFSRLDSVATKTAAASARPDQVLMQPAATAGPTRRSTFDGSDQSAGPIRARLIGELPTPRVPRQAADVEGQVLVRFSVDLQGRPVMETFSVEASPSQLLTAAVRNVIPKMRFEPARVAGPDSKPIADVVQIGFRFTRER